MPKLTGRLTYLTYRAAATAAQALPDAVGTRVAGLGGRIAYRLLGDRRAMATRHQSRAADGGAGGTADARGVFDSYSRYWLEMLRLPADVRRGRVAERFETDGYEHVEQALAAGKGAIFALPHLGGWDYAAAYMSHRGHRMLAVVEPVEPPELYRWFVEQRRALGLDIVPLGPGVSGALLGALRENRIVCLLADRDLTGDGVEAQFFGERTTLPAGPATLALRTGAALLPIAVYFRPGGRHLALIRPALTVTREGRLREDVARVTQHLARELEVLIRAAPEQWHLMQPNWPSDRARTEER